MKIEILNQIPIATLHMLKTEKAQIRLRGRTDRPDFSLSVYISICPVQRLSPLRKCNTPTHTPIQVLLCENSDDPEQTLQDATPALGLHCLQDASHAI